MSNDQQALDRYNRLFDNDRYHLVADALAADLRTDRDAERVATLMNLVTDVALSLSGHRHYDDAWIKLAVVCAQNNINADTIALMGQYLLIYRQRGDTRVDDFELTAKALHSRQALSDPLKTAIACANGVHGWQGRTAYYLLMASDHLIQAALQLLSHGDLPHIGEKLRLGVRRLLDGIREGRRHSPRAEVFDFSANTWPQQDQ